MPPEVSDAGLEAWLRATCDAIQDEAVRAEASTYVDDAMATARRGRIVTTTTHLAKLRSALGRSLPGG